MVAGLPGVGIGGVYYMLLVILMPLREMYLWYKGQESRSRRRIAVLVLLASAMVAALRAQAWFIVWVFTQLELYGITGPATKHWAVQATYVPWVVATGVTFAVLAFILVGTYLLRLVTGNRHDAARITVGEEPAG